MIEAKVLWTIYLVFACVFVFGEELSYCNESKQFFRNLYFFFLGGAVFYCIMKWQ